MNLENTVSDFIFRENLLPPGERVILALSGGADSTALAHVLCALREKHSFTLYALHVHHGIRGAEADRDEAFCRALAERLGIGFFCRHFDVPALARESGESLELCARRVRYACLSSLAAQIGARFAATAHHADDALETALFNFARGTGLRGLAGIQPAREMDGITLIRPFLCVTRAQIEKYLAEIGEGYCTDSTNASDAYARNRIRRSAADTLRTVNPAFSETGVHTMSALRDAADFLQISGMQALGSVRRDGGAEIAGLLSLHRALQACVIEALYREAAGPDAPELESVHIRQVLALCENSSPNAVCDLPKGIRARREYCVLYIEKSEQNSIPVSDIPLTPGEDVLFADRFLIRTERTEERPAEYKNVHNFVVDCSKIYGKLSIGTRQPGESIRLAGHNGTVSLKKIMIDRRIPRPLRDRLPVIRDEKGILAAARIGVDACAAIDEDTKEFLIISIEER